ncbi:hypothetical protein ACIA8G_19375 [Lentzea sp. NPDC051213]|uniref:hypothetical protein n=1 Tax=Lentzea sp. NPDC051213 TaxID=3364126 RepID=UPI0037981B40
MLVAPAKAEFNADTTSEASRVVTWQLSADLLHQFAITQRHLAQTPAIRALNDQISKFGADNTLKIATAA